MNSKYLQTLAILLGLVIPFIPEIGPFPISTCLIYFFAGGLLGFLSPKESWRWGLWIVAPMAALLVLSVVFAGQIEMLFKKDLPLLFLALISASLGSFLFARFKQSRNKVSERK